MADAPPPTRPPKRNAAVVSTGLSKKIARAESSSRGDNDSDAEIDDSGDESSYSNPPSGDESEGGDRSDASNASDQSCDSDGEHRATSRLSKKKKMKDGFGSGEHDRVQASERQRNAASVRAAATARYHAWRKSSDCPTCLQAVLGSFEKDFANSSSGVERELSIARMLKSGHIVRYTDGLCFLSYPSRVKRVILGPAVTTAAGANAVLDAQDLALDTMAAAHRVVYVESHFTPSETTPSGAKVSRHALFLMPKEPPEGGPPVMHVFDENGSDSCHARRVARLLSLPVAPTAAVHGLQRATELYVTGQYLGKHMGWCSLWAMAMTYLVDQHLATYDDVLHLLGQHHLTEVEHSVVLVRRATTEIYQRTIDYYKQHYTDPAKISVLVQQCFPVAGDESDLLELEHDDGPLKHIDTTTFDGRSVQMHYDDRDGTLWIGGGTPKRALTDEQRAAQHDAHATKQALAPSAPSSSRSRSRARSAELPAERVFQHIGTNDWWQEPLRRLPQGGFASDGPPNTILYVQAQIPLPCDEHGGAVPLRTVIVHLPVKHDGTKYTLTSPSHSELFRLRAEMQRLVSTVFPSAGAVPPMERWWITIYERVCQAALKVAHANAVCCMQTDFSDSMRWIFAPWLQTGVTKGSLCNNLWTRNFLTSAYSKLCKLPRAKFEFTRKPVFSTVALRQLSQETLGEPEGVRRRICAVAKTGGAALTTYATLHASHADRPSSATIYSQETLYDHVVAQMSREGARFRVSFLSEDRDEFLTECSSPHDGSAPVMARALAPLNALSDPAKAVWVRLETAVPSWHHQHTLSFAVVHPRAFTAMPMESRHLKRSVAASLGPPGSKTSGLQGGPRCEPGAFEKLLANILVHSDSELCDAIAPVHKNSDPASGSRAIEQVPIVVTLGCYGNLGADDRTETGAPMHRRTTATFAAAKFHATFTFELRGRGGVTHRNLHARANRNLDRLAREIWSSIYNHIPYSSAEG